MITDEDERVSDVCEEAADAIEALAKIAERLADIDGRFPYFEWREAPEGCGVLPPIETVAQQEAAGRLRMLAREAAEGGPTRD